MIDAAALSNLLSWSTITEKSAGGFWLSTGTVVLTIVLELASLDTVQNVLRQKDGENLYRAAVASNFVNHYLFGIPVYAVATILFCQSGVEASQDQQNDQLLSWTFYMKIVGIVAIHDFLYWFVHKTMHSSPKLYVWHKFHHRFHAHVPPSSANAVSPVEYCAAYIFPFAAAAILVAPTDTELNWAVAWTSVANLILHTPRLEPLTQQWMERWTPWLVSTHDHMEHHRRLTTNYSAPILKYDWILNPTGSRPQQQQQQSPNRKQK